MSVLAIYLAHGKPQRDNLALFLLNLMEVLIFGQSICFYEMKATQSLNPCSVFECGLKMITQTK